MIYFIAGVLVGWFVPKLFIKIVDIIDEMPCDTCRTVWNCGREDMVIHKKCLKTLKEYDKINERLNKS
jgi:hypothetical protein